MKTSNVESRSVAPVVLITGRSGTGKTTFLEKLVPELKARGYRVAVVKHTKDVVDWDRPGKDSWRLAQAGSDKVVLCSPERVLVNTRVAQRVTLDEAVRVVGGDYDIVLVEGFHEADAPRIAVHRRDAKVEPLPWGEGLMAVVTDEKLSVDVPQFGWEDVKGVTDLIEQKLMAGKRRG